MAWRDRLTVYARCNKHPKFNPVSGQGAIKAGCVNCVRLFFLFRDFGDMERRIRLYNEDTAARRKP